MLERSTSGRATLGADRGYDTRDFVAVLRGRGVTPHVARNDRRRLSAVDGRTTRHAGYGLSQRRRKLRYVGRARNRGWLELAAAVGDCPGGCGSAGTAPRTNPVTAIAAASDLWPCFRPLLQHPASVLSWECD